MCRLVGASGGAVDTAGGGSAVERGEAVAALRADDELHAVLVTVAGGDPATMIAPAELRKVFDLDIEVHDIGGRRIGVYFSWHPVGALGEFRGALSRGDPTDGHVAWAGALPDPELPGALATCFGAATLA